MQIAAALKMVTDDINLIHQTHISPFHDIITVCQAWPSPLPVAATQAAATEATTTTTTTTTTTIAPPIAGAIMRAGSRAETRYPPHPFLILYHHHYYHHHLHHQTRQPRTSGVIVPFFGMVAALACFPPPVPFSTSPALKALTAPILDIARKVTHEPGKTRGNGPSPAVSIGPVGSAYDWNAKNVCTNM